MAKYPDLPVAVEQVSGLATGALLERAEGAEILVLGSRGHGAIAGFLLGSVGQHVLARVNVPVVLVRALDRPAADAMEPDVSEVVVGIQDRNAPAEELLGFAFSSAAAHGATLHAVHAWSRPPVFGYNPAAVRMGDEDGGMAARVERELSDCLKPWQKRYPQVKVVQTIALASAAEVVLQAGRNARLVVLGREAHRAALGMRIGPVTHGVIHHAAAPVAVVPHD